MAKVDWAEASKPLIKMYKGKKHPLNYENTYQLLVMVVLSAQDSDRNINSLAPSIFKAFPNMEALAKVEDPELLYPYIGKVRNFGNKAKWLTKIAQQVKKDKDIPMTMEGLTALPGIGRKSANVIMRESGIKAEGVIVDLHVVRVGERLGITKSSDPKKIEQDIMQVIPEKDWGEIGMAISFLGREICRPSNPQHDLCPMATVCEYYQQNKG
jgi:endonuclease III